MAEEDEETEKHLKSKREHIIRLQSERARKLEALDRLETKLKAVADEVEERQKSCDLFQDRYVEAQRHQKDEADRKNTDPSGEDEKKQEVKEQKIREFVAQTLGDRIPWLKKRGAAEEELEAGEDDGKQIEQQDQGKEKDKPQMFIDTVLITHIPENKTSFDERYLATFRIHPNTQIGALHKDACDYWGCSERTYTLASNWRKGEEPKDELSDLRDKGTDKPVTDPEQDQNKLGQKGVLNQYFTAELFLVSTDRVAMLNEGTGKKKQSQGGNAPDEHMAMRSAKRSLKDAWLEALKPWQGLYYLLVKRKKALPYHRKVLLRDLIVFILLITFGVLSDFLRSPGPGLERVSLFHLVSGFQAIMVYSNHTGEPFEKPLIDQVLERPPINLHDVRTRDELWFWMNTTLAEQVFSPGAELRRYHHPMGYMRIGLQLAREVGCPRARLMNTPGFASEVCYEPWNDRTVTPENRLLEVANWTEHDSTRFRVGDPRNFTSAEDNTYGADFLNGLHHPFTADGYFVDYNVNSSNLTGSEKMLSFKQDLTALREADWMGVQTRLVTIELTVYNAPYDRFINFLTYFEAPPTGVLVPTVIVRPFSLGVSDTSAESTAWLVDWFRMALVVYVATVVPLSEINYYVYQDERMTPDEKEIYSKQIGDQPNGKAYLMSFNGIVDAFLVATFLLMFLVRISGSVDQAAGPPDEFRSFLDVSRRYEQLVVADSVFLFLCIVRSITFLRLSRAVNLMCVTMRVALIRYFLFFFMFALPMFGFVFFAVCIWGAHIAQFQTLPKATLALLLFVRGDLDLRELADVNAIYTTVFMAMFYLIIVCFYTNAFTAIMCQSYFEVKITDGYAKGEGRWSRADWIKWATPARRKGEDDEEDGVEE